AGSFAFSLSGIDAVENPFAAAGNFTSDAAGNITAGVNDSNDDGGILLNDPLTGAITVGGGGPGTATFNTGRATLSFALYVVDGSPVKLVELDGTPVLGGDAFRQTGPFSNASLSGPFAFTLAGADVLNAAPFAAGGVFVSSGTGTITGGTEDFNDGGIITA